MDLSLSSAAAPDGSTDAAAPVHLDGNTGTVSGLLPSSFLAELGKIAVKGPRLVVEFSLKGSGGGGVGTHPFAPPIRRVVVADDEGTTLFNALHVLGCGEVGGGGLPKGGSRGSASLSTMSRFGGGGEVPEELAARGFGGIF